MRCDTLSFVFTVQSLLLTLFECMPSIKIADQVSKILNEASIDLDKLLLKYLNEKKLAELKINNSSSLLRVLADHKKVNVNLVNYQKNLLFNTTTSKSIQNREIKIIYKPAKSTLKTNTIVSDSQRFQLVSIENLNDPENTYVRVLINKELATILGCLLIVILIAFIVLFCFYRFINTSKNDSYYFYRYHKI